MKKNLRIVSAAAAALLAVAPVAATAVVSAPTSTVQAATKEDTVATLSDIKPVGTTGDDASKANAFGTLTAADVKYAKETESAFTGSEAAKINAPTLKVNGIANPVEGKYVSKSVSLDGVAPSDKKDVTVGSHVIKANYIYTLPEAASADVAATIGGKAVIIPKGVKTIHVTFSKTVIMAAKDDTTTTSPSFNFGSSSIFDADANVGVNITAIAGWDGTTRLPGFGSFSGNITAAVNGQNYTALLHTDNANGVNVSVKDQKGNPVHSAHDLNTRTLYTATIKGVVFNLGSSMQGKSVTLQLPDNARFVPTAAQKSSVPNPGTFNGKADNNGLLTVPTIETDFYAMDPTDMKGLNFYSVKTGEQVQNGSVTLHAVNGQGNVESVYAALNHEYKATQVFNDKHETSAEENVRVVMPINDIRDQLKKQNIDVDPNGYFKAPSSLSLTLNAKSPYNGATASMPVTVNFDNATSNNNAAETTKTVTIMHISTIYDKNGKATHEPALRAYDTYSVVATPVNLKDEKGKDAGMFYKLAGKDQYIKVGNVDGTSRSLKKNSYVYKSTGKAYMKSKKHHRVLKAGSSVKTYGKSFMIAGHQMYRIGKNQYVKKANF